MNEKIRKAIEYVNTRDMNVERKGYTIDDVMNDAANIFADNYDEYLKIWDALEKVASR